MMPELRASALRRGRGAVLALICALAALFSLGGMAVASAASAGQIVWSASGAIWAMNDNGSDPHQLIAPTSPKLASPLPSGTLSEPDVFQNGGTTVLFVGLTSAFAAPSLPAACGADCSGTFELSKGTLTELAPPAAPATAAAYYERQPRVTADGQEIFGSSLYTGIMPSSTGTPATALVERPLAANATVTQWSDTDSEAEPAAGFDGAPDPADPTLAAWVESQGCGFYVLNAQNVEQASCQYAVHFGALSDLNARVVVYDNEFVSSGGRGPTSLALSTDGATLLMVDPYLPATGIYATPVAGLPGQKPVTELIAQPAGWTFGQARFAGSKIVFDAHQQVAGKTTGDIYAISAGCTAASCTFPASATNLTNDPLADSSDPAWTSATTPLAPLRVAVGSRVTKVTTPATPIHTGRRFTLAVTLSAPATIVVKIIRRLSTAPKTRTVGSISFAGKTGVNSLSIRLLAGKALAVGSYTATIALRGSSAAPKTVHFSVEH